MGWLRAELQSLVGNERGFIHKKLLGGISKITGFLPGPVAGFVSGITRKLSQTTAQKEAARRAKFDMIGTTALVPTGETTQQRLHREIIEARRTAVVPLAIHGGIGGGGRAPCELPLVRGPAGNCLFPGSPVGVAAFGGEAIMGQFGAAMVPGSQIIDRATCLPGMQLGKDGYCYNKSAITNSQRMWPAGRKPLLSGGDMRAISVAARAGRRMELATKRLQKMGMMKKATARRALPRGHVARLEHGSEH